MSQCSNRSGAGRQCARAAEQDFKHCSTCRERDRRGRAKARLDPATAAFEQLINRHGFRADHPTAKALAAFLSHPKQRCQICGVPNTFLQTLQRAGGPFPFWGNPSHWRRLVPDHIDVARKGEPDTTNIRPLCPGCNQTRGAGRLTDEAVLMRMRKEWIALFPERQLKWLR